MSDPVKKRILLVEDEALLAMNEKVQLEKYGYSVRTVTTGEKAIEVVAMSSNIDLILMDINLGSGIDGTQAGELILQDHDIPIVFLSSHTEPEVVEKTEKITSYGYVVKNSNIAVLDASIKMAFKLFNATKETARLEKQYLEFFRHSPYAVALQEMVYDDTGTPIDHRFIAVNQASEAVTGLKPEQMVNRTALELFPSTEQHWNVMLGEVARTGEPITVEDYSQALDKYIEVTAFRSENNRVATMVADITGRKRAEETVRKSRDLFQSSIEALSYPFAIINADTYTIEFANTALGGQDAVGKTCYSVLYDKETPCNDPNHPCPINILRESGKSTTLQHVHRDEHGKSQYLEVSTYPIFDSDGRLVRIAESQIDITERKNTEDALRESEGQFRSLADIAKVMIAIVADASGSKYLYVNAEWQRALGYSREEAQEIKPIDLVAPESRQQVLDYAALRIEGKNPPANYELKLITKSGDRIIVDFTSTIIIFAHRKALLTTAVDITARKHAEEEIQHQLAEKETLLKEVHHRIKNNMAQVESLLSIQAYSADSTAVKSALQEAMSRVRSTRTLYEKLLIGEGYEAVSIKDYLENLIDSLIEVFNSRSDVSVEKSIVDFPVSPKKVVPIGIMLNELVTNVFKYAFTGRDGGYVSIELAKTKTRVTLTVTDDGVGLDKKVDAKNPSGFGLSLVNMLAEQLGGTFSIESDNGTRSVVEFET